MPHFSFMELVIIMVVILLLFGAKRIPEIAGSVGKGIKEFKKEMNDMERSVTNRDPGPPPRLTSEDLQRPSEQTQSDAEQREPRRLL
ncbi:MAG: twin-arginine translocase TatA/TatE family subunit [Gemmatimonadaceae bacterium]